MRNPKMILFDYGDTLGYEPDIDWRRGAKALLGLTKRNPQAVTAEQFCTFTQAYFDAVAQPRARGMECRTQQVLRMALEFWGLELSVSLEEADALNWEESAPCRPMPGAAALLAYLRAAGIRTGVISNICISGAGLAARLGRLLPAHSFEFVLASSEYGIRKPVPLLFELALRRAGLAAEDVWFCGDNVTADIEGAAGVGIFPVWYQGAARLGLNGAGNVRAPACPHLRLDDWSELPPLLQSLRP